MVLEQVMNVVEKELVPLLREKWLKNMKEAGTWADNHVFAHQIVTHQGR